jgi:hypothetical protein
VGTFINCLINFLAISGDSKLRFQNPTITPSGRKVTGVERKKEREKMLLIEDT